MNNRLPKPGDLFEWVYKSNNSPMQPGENLYSSMSDRWISGADMCLCIGIYDNIIHWISKQMLFCARTNELGWKSNSLSARVTPRKIQLRTRVKHER